MKQFKVSQSITNRDSDAIKLYLKDVSRIPLITSEEEVELAEKIQQGDKKALDKLVTSNLRFVISVAKQYQGQGIPLIDLINEGNVGLIKAAKRFDHTRGFKFISYAVWWIKQAIIQALSTESRTIRLPVSQSGLSTKIYKTIIDFEQKYERIPSNEELSKLLDIPENKIVDIMSSNTSCVSVETPFGDEDEGCLLDVLENKNALSGYSIVKEEDKNTNLELLLSKFDDRDSDILRMFFGLERVQQLPFDEIGKRFGLTGERVRQIKDKTLETIKNKYKKLAKELL